MQFGCVLLLLCVLPSVVSQIVAVDTKLGGKRTPTSYYPTGIHTKAPTIHGNVPTPSQSAILSPTRKQSTKALTSGSKPTGQKTGPLTPKPSISPGPQPASTPTATPSPPPAMTTPRPTTTNNTSSGVHPTGKRTPTSYHTPSYYPTGIHTKAPTIHGNVPTPSQSAILSPTRKQSTKALTSGSKPTGQKTGPPTPKPSISPGPQPASTPTPTLSPPPGMTTPRPTTTNNTSSGVHPTVTVSNGQTVSAFVGWVVVGVGTGGAVVAGGEVLPVAGGAVGVIVENGSGQDELSSTTTSSSSPTARPTPYNIYPRRGSTAPEQSVFTRNLELIAQPGSVRRITGVRGRLLLWVASLTPDQASELGRNTVVQGINEDLELQIDLETLRSASAPTPSGCPSENCSHQRRDGTLVMQRNALDDLKLFSQARGASLSGLPGYAYDSKAGVGITVYILDTGLDQDHPEFRNIRLEGRIRWLFLPGEPDGPENETDDTGHGTCVASKVVGRKFGVAKSVNIVIVKIHPIDGRIRTSRAIAALGTVAGDIARKDLQGRSVVCIASGVDPDRLTDVTRTTYIGAVEDLMGLDAVMVVASGNINDANPGFALATYPALLGSRFPIVVVGGVNTAGIYGRYSQGMAFELTVSASGSVICASRQGGVTQGEGTSFSAPAVAGLAAYLMSLDQYRTRIQVPGSVARNVRDLIKSLAYARQALQPAVVWNGIDSRQVPCPAAARRDDESPGCPAVNATQPVAPPRQTVPSGPATPSSNPLPSSTTTVLPTASVGSEPVSESVTTITLSGISVSESVIVTLAR